MYERPEGGRVGWGGGGGLRLWRAAGDVGLVHQVAAGRLALQNDDGSWLATGVYGGAAAEADSVTIDVTSEFVTLQSFMGTVPVV